MSQAVEEGDDATVRHLLSGTVKAFRKELETHGTLKYLHEGGQVREVNGKNLESIATSDVYTYSRF